MSVESACRLNRNVFIGSLHFLAETITISKIDTYDADPEPNRVRPYRKVCCEFRDCVMCCALRSFQPFNQRFQILIRPGKAGDVACGDVHTTNYCHRVTTFEDNKSNMTSDSADTLNTAELYRLITESDFHTFSLYQLSWNRP